MLAPFAKRMEVTDFFLREQAEPFLVDHARAGGGAEPRPGHLLHRLRTHPARPDALQLRRARQAGRRASARVRRDPRPPLPRHRSPASGPRTSTADRMSSRRPRPRAELLEDAEERIAEHPSDVEHADAMLVDLSRRLDARGLTTALDYRGTLGLVASYEGRASRSRPTRRSQSSSLRESLRLRPEMLKRLGWHYLRVHSFELFADPESVALKIAVALGARAPGAAHAGDSRDRRRLSAFAPSNCPVRPPASSSRRRNRAVPAVPRPCPSGLRR